ncbi:hypothetical protein M514_23480 [Trichuris suis]|uniref:Uncharacterized protein n=1 Tax=Trichuris suis TaxID=68888 RepID=A0A085N4B6_9BILA|nr:hypothetical protein M514_23480 [Trichuris suis]
MRLSPGKSHVIRYMQTFHRLVANLHLSSEFQRVAQCLTLAFSRCQLKLKGFRLEGFWMSIVFLNLQFKLPPLRKSVLIQCPMNFQSHLDAIESSWGTGSYWCACNSECCGEERNSFQWKEVARKEFFLRTFDRGGSVMAGRKSVVTKRLTYPETNKYRESSLNIVSF